jgi:hypothetical protein
LVTTHHTGRVGRPQKNIDRAWLQHAVSTNRNLTQHELASILGIHRNTLSYKLSELGLHQRFTELGDSDLDRVLKLYKCLRPNSGLRYATGFLRRHSLKIQRDCVRDSLKRIDNLGRVLRQQDAILRRKYISRHSRAVLHIDGHRKLILWGFVIHGMIDGHDHVVSVLTPSIHTLTGGFVGYWSSGKH